MSLIFLSQNEELLKTAHKIVITHPDIYHDTYLFDTLPSVQHFDNNICHFRKHDGVMYRRGRLSFYQPLQLKSMVIPENTFLSNNHESMIVTSNEDIFVCIDELSDKESANICLSIMQYLECHDTNIKNIYIAKDWINSFTNLDSFDADVLKTLVPFEPIMQKISEDLMNTQFACSTPKQKNIINLRMEVKMSRTEFAKYLSIPYRTVENWETDKNKCPPYLYDLIEYKLENEELFYTHINKNLWKRNDRLDLSVFGKATHLFEYENIQSVLLCAEKCSQYTIDNSTHESDIVLSKEEIYQIIENLLINTRTAISYDWENGNGMIDLLFANNDDDSIFNVSIYGKDKFLNAPAIYICIRHRGR